MAVHDASGLSVLTGIGMRIRRVLLAAPLVLLLIFAAAFMAARPRFSHKQDQLVQASIGEPERLNPVLSGTQSDFEVEGFIFDGMLRFNENAELEPAMAERYVLSQTAHLYFRQPEDVASAEKAIHDHQGQWQDLGLNGVKADGDSLVLQMSKAGAGYRDNLLQWISPVAPVPVQLWKAHVAPKTEWQGRPVNSDTFIEWLQQTHKTRAGHPRVLYAWRNTSASFEIYTVGADGAFIDDLQRRFAEHIGAQTMAVAVSATPPVPEKTPATAAASQATASAPAAVPPERVPQMQVKLQGPLEVVFSKQWSAQDEPQILFNLRKGIRWHDGEPFTAQDVQFTYQAIMDEKSASVARTGFELVKTVEVPDDYTVLVTYKEPFSPCLYSWGTAIIPKHILAKEKDIRNPVLSDFDRHPIGTGPFKLASWQTAQQLVLERYDDYWEGRPNLPQVVYRILPDATVKQLEFQTGGFDYDSGGLEPYQVKRYKLDPRYTVYSRLETRYTYIGWNLANPLFQDKRVRYALACAVNVPSIVDYIMYGNAQQCTGPFTPVVPWWNPNIKPIPYDTDKARQLLAEAGWKPGADGILEKDGRRFSFKLITNNGNVMRKDISVLVQRDLRKIGIEVNVVEYEWAVFIKNYIDPRNFDACCLGWGTSLEPDLYQIWHSSQVGLKRSSNFVSYANPEVDRLIEQARTEFDMEKVRQVCWKVSQLIYDDQPYLFLYYPIVNYPLRKGAFSVRRPGPSGTWIEEPIRDTKLGYDIYLRWWMRTNAEMTASD
jgi:peptide/nickel transport system substrate-binding protein